MQSNILKHSSWFVSRLSLHPVLQSISENKELKDPAKDPQYSEPQVDSMRAQKDQVGPGVHQLYITTAWRLQPARGSDYIIIPV